MRERIIKLLGGHMPTLTPAWMKCCVGGCCMVHGHGGPHREYNGLAFSTNRRKARQAAQQAVSEAINE